MIKISNIKRTTTIFGATFNSAKIVSSKSIIKHGSKNRNCKKNPNQHRVLIIVRTKMRYIIAKPTNNPTNVINPKIYETSKTEFGFIIL